MKSPLLRATFASDNNATFEDSTAADAATASHRDIPLSQSVASENPVDGSDVSCSDNAAGNSEQTSNHKSQALDVKSQIDKLLSVVNKLSDRVERQSKAIHFLSRASSSLTDTCVNTASNAVPSSNQSHVPILNRPSRNVDFADNEDDLPMNSPIQLSPSLSCISNDVITESQSKDNGASYQPLEPQNAAANLHGVLVQAIH